MKALTVQQPWAWALIHGGKDRWAAIAVELEAYQALTQYCTDQINETAASVLDTPLEFM